MSAPVSQDPKQDETSLELRRRRLLYSLNDLQQALSACDFLYECEEDQKYSKIDLRRFMCFETTLVIAYTRPFSQSHGKVPRLTMEMVDLTLSTEQQAMHERLIQMRNQIMAHSDAEMMRMTIQAFDVEIDDKRPFYMIQTVFDEGITLHGSLLIEANGLLSAVHHAVFMTLHHEVQANPELFNLRVDSEKARQARNMRE